MGAAVARAPLREEGPGSPLKMAATVAMPAYRNSYAVAPRPAGSEVLQAARSVRRLRRPRAAKERPDERIPLEGFRPDSAKKEVGKAPITFGLSAAKATPTPRSRGDADSESYSPPGAAALAAASDTTLSGYDQKRITGLHSSEGETVGGNNVSRESGRECRGTREGCARPGRA